MVQVIQRSEIGLKAPKSVTKFKAKPKGLAWHWEGGGNPEATLEDSKATLRSIQTSHMNNKAEGYVDIAYCVGFDSLGNIFILRGFDVQGGANGTAAANSSHVSVVYLSGPGEPFTDAAKDAARVIRGMADSAGVGPENKPHSAFKATSCPGPDITQFIKTLSGTAAPAPSPTPAPAPAPAPSVPAFPGYVRQGTRGAIAGAWQHRLRGRGWPIVVDNDFGPKSTAILRAFQAEKGLVDDGIGGPLTWNKLWTAPIS